MANVICKYTYFVALWLWLWLSLELWAFTAPIYLHHTPLATLAHKFICESERAGGKIIYLCPYAGLVAPLSRLESVECRGRRQPRH